MLVTLLASAFATPATATEIEVTGAQFLDLLADETNAESLECYNENDKLNGPGFILARYRPEAASKNLGDLDKRSETEVFCFDIDEMTVDELAESMPLWAEYSCCIYSTWKHTPEAPRLRLLVELDEPVPNHAKEPYTSLYRAAADELRVKMDTSTKDRARLFFGPQHKPGADTERVRFNGKPLSVNKLRHGGTVGISWNVAERQSEQFDVTLDRPERQEIKKLADHLRKSPNARRSKVGAAMGAMLRGEGFAPEGSRHNTTMHMAFELTRVFGQFDAEWFADTYLMGPWAGMWNGEGDKARTDWLSAVSSAVAKHEARKGEAERFRAVEERAELTEEQLAAAEALKGRLVVSYRSVYYVYDVRCAKYKGPYKGGELAVAVRECLDGVPGISEVELTRAGLNPKSAIKLHHEYGSTCEGVIYYAKRPPTVWDREGQAICLQAYQWIKWDPVYHEIADELLHAIAGDHYELLEAYLYKFRDLNQPLPALTLVGPRKTWKSRMCEILARFWTNREGSSPADAAKTMTRFNSHLLKNPVIWSDEQLAVTSYGRPQPEAYRKSITSRVHQIEQKGLDYVTLVSAVRHMISVNDDAKVFSSEVDADSIHATMERFLLLYTDTLKMETFEKKWEGTPEMDRLRSGESLLEHVRWLEMNKNPIGTGRLFVEPHTDAQVLMRARFADDTLFYIWELAFDALKKETKYSKKGQLHRLPLVLASDQELRFSPERTHFLWGKSEITAGISVKKPSIQKIGQILAKAGFKKFPGERASKAITRGWAVNIEVLKQFMETTDSTTYEELADWAKQCRPAKESMMLRTYETEGL